jgi:chromosome partitioning protein
LLIISVISQKGGVGKSSISRTIAVEFTRAGWKTLLADTDPGQATASGWVENRRRQADIKPDVSAQVFHSTHQALMAAPDVDLLVIDGAPHATQGTLEAAIHSDLIIIPTGSSLDDMEPGIFLAKELAKSLNSYNIVFVLYRTTSVNQVHEARETITGHGFTVLEGHIPMKTGYITALDTGRCLTETLYPALNNYAIQVVNSISVRISN